MAEWFYEAGIGETRAALVADDRILEAWIERDGEGPRVGAVLGARLVEPGRVVLDAPGDP
ncbi:MAG: ribonuclease, partial [Sphingopyxis sp.]